MNISELALVRQRLEALLRQPVHSVSRQKEMILFTFGEQMITLRIQCFYRLMEEGRILAASSDVYQPSEAMWEQWEAMGYAQDEIPPDFHPEAPGANRLDEYLERLNGDLEGLEVRGAMLGHTGDLTLVFASGATLQVMVDTAGGEECWRLMDGHGQEDDLVVYGDGVELVAPDDVE